MSRLVKKAWGAEEGVSPVIATILMVAITVVLAGVLIVYLPTLQKTEKAKPTVSFRVTVKDNGDWKVTIEGGKLAWGNMQLVIRNDTVGKKVDLSGSSLQTASGNVTTDNGGSVVTFFDGGDAITITKATSAAPQNMWPGDGLEIYYAGDRLYEHTL
ncbi:MAG: type IV pilin N-terminal domain-containing protein [Candidatus Thermoplasmatota archaeon]